MNCVTTVLHKVVINSFVTESFKQERGLVTLLFSAMFGRALIHALKFLREGLLKGVNATFNGQRFHLFFLQTTAYCF